MKDLDDLLREDARAWRTPPVSAPDLGAALGRARWRRGWIASTVAVLAVVAVAAAGAVLSSRQQAPVPAIPDPRATPTVTGSASPSPSQTEVSIAGLAGAVRDNAAEFGIPVSAVAVRTTWLTAQEFLPADGTDPPGETEVWLAQVSGEFNCDNCHASATGPEAGSSVLVLVLDAHDLVRYYVEGGDVTRPLGNLGEVVTLDLSR